MNDTNLVNSNSVEHCYGECVCQQDDEEDWCECRDYDDDQEGAECDYYYRDDECLDGDIKSYCSDSMIALASCTGCKTDRRYIATCDEMKMMGDDMLNVRLMKDINLADGMQIVSYGEQCYGQWEPLDLYKVDLDGNHHKIISENLSNRCSITYPLFENIIHSNVDNLIMDYDMSGQTAGALFNYVARSALTNIVYQGNVQYGQSLYGEDYDLFGALGGYVKDSFIAHVDISANISGLSSHEMNGLIGRVHDSQITDIEMKLDSFVCGFARCSGVFGELMGRTTIRDIEIEIEKLEYRNFDVSGIVSVAYGYWHDHNNIDGKVYINDVHSVVHQMVGMKGSFFGIGRELYAEENNMEIAGIKIQIDSAITKGDFYGVALENVRNISNSELIFNDIEIDGHFYGVGYNTDDDVGGITNSVIKYGHIVAGGNIYLVGSMAEINHLVIVADDVMSINGDVYGLTSQTFFEASFNHIEIYAKRLAAMNGNVIGLVSRIGEDVSVSKVTFYVDEMIAKYKTLFINSYGYPDFWDISIYGNLYTTDPSKISGFVGNGEIPRDYSVTSARLFSYQSLKSDGTLEGVQELDGPFLYLELEDEYDDMIHWLKRRETNYAVKGNNHSDFVPFTKDEIDDVVSDLGDDWTSIEVEEDGEKFRIPWYRIDFSEELKAKRSKYAFPYTVPQE